MKTITVHASQTYPIWIGRGLLGQCGTYLKQQTKAQTAAVITDDHVDCYYGDIVTKSLEENGFRTIKFVFPHGEASKCSKTLNQIYDFLCENNITRTDCLVALGGGVVGDITGFAAATYLRGLDYLQIPTSLLAQVDSSVGGKTAIDLTGGKNLVGAFKQPVAVLCDLDTLHTLPKLFLADGMGEVIKYGMIRDEKLFTLLEQHTLETVSEVMDEIVPTCIDIKRDVVEHDEFDTGERMILNFGHTLGHAVESYYHYETYTHGSAVAAGMCMMTKATCTPELYVRLCDCVKAYDLPTEVDAPVRNWCPCAAMTRNVPVHRCGLSSAKLSAGRRFAPCLSQNLPHGWEAWTHEHSDYAVPPARHCADPCFQEHGTPAADLCRTGRGHFSHFRRGYVRDITATMDVLSAFGASFRQEGSTITVTGVGNADRRRLWRIAAKAALRCGS